MSDEDPPIDGMIEAPSEARTVDAPIPDVIPSSPVEADSTPAVKEPTSNAVLYLRCGCMETSPVPDSAGEWKIPMLSPNKTESFDLRFVRILGRPSTFLEEVEYKKPDWALEVHSFAPFDYRVFGFDLVRWGPTFEAYRMEYGPVVPQCWVSELIRGSGRFSGVWYPAYEHGKKGGRRHGHLHVYDGGMHSPPPRLALAPGAPPIEPARPLQEKLDHETTPREPNPD